MVDQHAGGLLQALASVEPCCRTDSRRPPELVRGDAEQRMRCSVRVIQVRRVDSFEQLRLRFDAPSQLVRCSRNAVMGPRRKLRADR